MLVFAGCRIDLETGAVVGGRGIALTERERALLAYFAARPNRVVPRDELLERVWGYSDRVISRAADNAMRRLREKVEADPSRPRHLLTVFGEGYRYLPLASDAPSPSEAVGVAVEGATPGRALVFADRTVDLDLAVVNGPDGEIPLTGLEVKILAALAARAGRPVERAALIRDAWGDRTNRRSVDKALHRLRTKIEIDEGEPTRLLTIRGVGYRLQLDRPVAARTERTLVCVALGASRADGLGADRDAAAAVAALARWLDEAARARAGTPISGGGQFAFETAEAGLAFAVAVHRDAPARDPSIPVRIGVHCGAPIVWVDPVTGGTGVVGPEVHRVVDLADRAAPGATLASAEAWEAAGTALGVEGVFVAGGAVQIGGACVPAEGARALPWVHDRFVGRSALVAEVLDAVEADRLVALVGPPGVGKSRIALEACGRIVRSGGVVHVPLGQTAGAEGFLGAVAGALQIPLRGKDGALQLRNALARRPPTLLWLDDLDQAVAAARGFVEEWIAAAPDLSVLATVRRATQTNGERTLAVPPLDEDDGVALFLERSSGPIADRVAVREVVRGLDGLPLAIELAAARTIALSPAQLLALLPSRLRLLRRSDAPSARHRSMRAALDVSWSLLDEHERRVFARCAVFRGGFTPAAAEAVLDLGEAAPWAIDTLEALVRHQLIRVGASRYYLLDSVAAYAEARLAEDPEREAAAYAAHGRYFASLCVPATDTGRADGGHDAYAALPVEIANLEAAVARALEVRDVVVAEEVALGLSRIVRTQGPYALGIGWLGRVRALGGARSLEIRIALGRLKAFAGEAGALDEFEAALHAARAAGDGVGEADATVSLAEFGVSKGPDHQRDHFQRALALARRVGVDNVAQRALVGLGRTMGGEAGRAYVSEALGSARRQGHRLLEAVALVALGHIDLDLGQHGRAQEVLEEGLAAFRDLDDLNGERGALILLSIALRHRDPDAAEGYLQASLRIERRLGSVEGEATTLVNLADLASDRGDLAGADAHLRAAIRLAAITGSAYIDVHSRAQRGEVLRLLGRHGEARDLLHQALDLADDLGYDEAAFDAAASLAQLPDADSGVLALFERLAPRAEAQPPDRHARFHIFRALLLDANGDRRGARALLPAIETLVAAVDLATAPAVAAAMDQLSERLRGDAPPPDPKR